MISVGNNKAVICKGDFHPAALYKGDKKIAGYTVEEFESENGVTLENCYNDKLHNVQIFGNTVQDGTPTPEAPVEVQSVGELVTEGEYAGKYKVLVTARGKNLFNCLNAPTFSHYNAPARSEIVERTANNITVRKTTDREWEFVAFKLPEISVGATITVYAEWACSSANGGMIRVNWNSQYEGNKIIASSQKSGVSASGVVTEKPVYSDYLGLLLYGGTVGKTGDEVHYKNIMVTIDEPSTAKPYEPYIEPQTFNIYLGEPLRKAGDYADYVDFDKNVVVRLNTEAEILKVGNDYRGMLSLCGYGYYNGEYQLLRRGKDRWKPLLCSHTNNINWSNASRELIAFYYADFGAADKTELQAKFDEIAESGTPLKVVYTHETPIEEPIELPELPTFKGTTIYEIATEIPATISGKYKKVEV